MIDRQRIMVVDDDQNMLKLLNRTLELVLMSRCVDVVFAPFLKSQASRLKRHADLIHPHILELFRDRLRYHAGARVHSGHDVEQVLLSLHLPRLITRHIHLEHVRVEVGDHRVNDHVLSDAKPVRLFVRLVWCPRENVGIAQPIHAVRLSDSYKSRGVDDGCCVTT